MLCIVLAFLYTVSGACRRTPPVGLRPSHSHSPSPQSAALPATPPRPMAICMLAARPSSHLHKIVSLKYCIYFFLIIFVMTFYAVGWCISNHPRNPLNQWPPLDFTTFAVFSVVIFPPDSCEICQLYFPPILVKFCERLLSLIKMA